MNAPLYAVVLAGGVGSRFWPLSTPSRPKQLLPLVTAHTMLDSSHHGLPLLVLQVYVEITDATFGHTLFFHELFAQSPIFSGCFSYQVQIFVYWNCFYFCRFDTFYSRHRMEFSAVATLNKLRLAIRPVHWQPM